MNSVKNKKRIKSPNSSRTPRINIIDIAVIVVLVLLVLLAIEYFTSFSFFDSKRTEHTIEYTLEFNVADSDMISDIAVGNVVRGSVGPDTLGEVKSTKIEPQVKYIFDPITKNMLMKELPVDASGKVPVRFCVTLKVTAEYKAGIGYTVNGNRISVGTPLSVNFGDFSGNGNCISINKVS